MKKLSKVLLVMLVLSLLCTAVFSAVASAAVTSANEAAVKGEISSLGAKANRFVEDFAGETIDVKTNINNGVSYDEPTNQNSVTSPVYTNLNKANHFGQWHTVSQLGLDYAELRLPEAYNYGNQTPKDVNPLIYLGGTNDQNGWTPANANRYVVVEWDMSTSTQYPAGFGIYTEMGPNAAANSYVQKIASADGEGNLTVGETTVSLGAAKEWHHYTLVLFLGNYMQNKQAKGAFYQDGELVSVLDAPTNNGTPAWVRFKSVMIGYYDEMGEFAADSTIAIDNVVLTQFRNGYNTAGNLLSQVVLGMQDITDVGGLEFVWDADYVLPEESKFVGVKADGETVYYSTFEQAYEAYSAGAIAYVEVHKDTEAVIDAPITVKTADGVTFTDTAADGEKLNVRQTADENGNVYHTFYTEDTSVQYTFYNNKEGAEVIQSQTLDFAVGTFPSLDGLTIAPMDVIDNPDDATTKLQFDGTWSVYRVKEGETPVLCDFSLVFPSDILAGYSYAVYPNYKVAKPYFEVSSTVEGSETPFVKMYFAGADYVSVFENLADGATIKLYRDLGFTATPVIKQTVYMDMNGFALYQNSNTKLNMFELAEGAELYLYSSVPGATLFAGFSPTESGLVFDYTGKADVHFGYQNAEDTDAYLNNITAYVGALTDNAVSESTLDVVGGNIYVANEEHDALLGFAPGVRDAVATLSSVTIYNNLPTAKSLVSFEDTLGDNTVSVLDSVIYTTAPKMITLITTVEEGSEHEANPNYNQSVSLTNTSIYGAVKGDAKLPVTLGMDCRFASYDADTVVLPENVVFIFDNRYVPMNAAYPTAAQYGNKGNMIPLTGNSATITTCLSTADHVQEKYCEVEWYFDEDIPSIKEYWVRGVKPEFRHEFPISESQRITYTYLGVGIGIIPEDAENGAKVQYKANERAVFELVGFAHNLSIHIGMNYYFYIPVDSAVFTVARGEEEPVEVSTLPKTEDGVYYIFTVAEMEVRNFATTAYELNFVLVTQRGSKLPLTAQAIPVNYMEGLLESEETTQQTKDLIMTFMDYVVKVADYFSTEESPIDVTAIRRLLSGSTVPAAAIDRISDEGGIRYGLQGAYLTLKSRPAFVYVIRPGFTGTITIDSVEYQIENGLCDGKDRIYWDVDSLGDLDHEMSIVISGMIGKVEIETSGKYSLANFYISQMDENGNTPAYISALYSYVKYAKAYEESLG